MNLLKPAYWITLPAVLATAAAVAQQPASLSADDKTAIQSLVTSYAKALGECHAKDFADLFTPTGSFISGFRGHMVGHERLVALVESERHCIAPSGAAPAARPGGTNGPTAVVEATATGARGVADLGGAEYQDEYTKTAGGWRIASRTVIIKTEKDAGLDSANEFLAIERLGGSKVGDYYEPDKNDVKRLMTSGVRVTVKGAEVTGRAFLKDGGYDDEVYEKVAPGNWRVKSSVHVPASRGAVLGTGAVTSFVENMDRSLAFYHDAFGMEVPPLPESGARPYNPSNAQLFAMFDIAGAKERHQSAKLPDNDVRLELMEVQNVEHRTIPLRVQDPGSLTLVFVVRDIAASLERARRAKADVVTPGGKSVKLTDGTRSVLIRDVDGRLIELRQPVAQAADAKGAEITAMRLSIAVGDLAKTVAVYRDVLGFTVDKDENLGGDAQLRALTGLPKAEFRRGVVHGPGSSLPFELVEYRGVDRKPLEMKIQDRGAARIQLRAENLEALVAKMRDAGLKIVSQGGAAVPIPPNFMGALVADPNNFFWTPIAPCDGCAPRLVSEAPH